MKYFNKIEKIALALIFTVFVIVIFANLKEEETFAGNGGVSATECDIFTQTAVSIGDDVSTEVVASHARNAYVLLELNVDETNGVYLGFGSAGVEDQGISLDASNITKLESGLNSNFPFTGAINAITDTSSTTLLVTVCRY